MSQRDDLRGAPRKERALQPAGSIVHRLGGEEAVASIIGTALTAPYRWQVSRERGGTGGLVPQRYHAELLAYARQARIRLRPQDFIQRERQDDRHRDMVRAKGRTAAATDRRKAIKRQHRQDAQ